MTFMLLVAAGVAVATAGYGLHRMALWAERRGWLYYRHRKPPRGAASMALIELDRIWKPEMEHVVDEMWSGEYRVIVDERDDR